MISSYKETSIFTVLYDEQVHHSFKKPYIDYKEFSSNNSNHDIILINGWSLAKNIYGNIDVENNHIKDNIYWIPSFSENREKHIEGIKYYNSYLPRIYYQNMIEFKFLDFLYNKIYDENSLNYSIDGVFDKVLIYKQRFIYFLYANILYGFDMEMFNYFGINTKTFIKDRIDSKTIFLNDKTGVESVNFASYYNGDDFLIKYLTLYL